MTEHLHKEPGKKAKKALERILKTLPHPMESDRKTTYPKLPIKDEDYYWIMTCPKCAARMHAIYYTLNGTRYMCESCGTLEGFY
ncbi:MAG: hypothetical protein M1269_07025 [Chloroflexi bacterium]|nr:hypothetical protein [Chloroflexota bacterium]